MAGLTATIGDHLVDLAIEASPVASKLLTGYGDRPLRSLLDSLDAGPATAPQPMDDFLRVVHDEIARRHDPTVAEVAVRELRADPVLPTSNHFGVDTFADSVQGTLLFSLRRPAGPRRVVVVLGFGSISMNNLTYPMGLRLYDPPDGALDRVPQRLPVLPNRVKRCTVAAAVGFDRAMVDRAVSRVRAAARAGEVSPFTEDAALAVLEQDYADEEVLALPGYADQAVRINTGLWRRLVRGEDAPLLVQLQIEPVCSALLGEDLPNRDSLAHQVFFTPAVRTRLLTALDGRRGCWRLDAATGGTVFFWALDERGHRVALTLTGDAGPRLVGAGVELPFTPAEVTAAVRTGRLVPSLFSCFLVLAFARGIGCVGGYFQAEYLPNMRDGLLDALAVAPELGPMADAVRAARVELCLSGVQGISRRLAGARTVPAGPVELAHAGGLSPADLDRLAELPVRDAFLLASAETFHHLVPDARLPAAWADLLAAENAASRGIQLG